MYDKNYYNIVISLQLIKIKKKKLASMVAQMLKNLPAMQDTWVILFNI